MVEQDIITKLRMCWPGFDPEQQLFKMNSDFAWHTLKVGYITDDYAELIDGLQKLLPMGLRHKLKMAHWYMHIDYHKLFSFLQFILSNTHNMTCAPIKCS